MALVWGSQVMKRYRHYQDDKINISGSSQFSDINKLTTLISDKNVIVCDLRSEPHIFITGKTEEDQIISGSVYWYIDENKLTAELSLIEFNEWLKKSITELPKIVEIYTDKSLTSHIRVKLIKIETEEKLVKLVGWGYFQIRIVDHHPPKLEQINDLIRLIKFIPKDTRIHFHCAGGKGRTSTIMMLYDILHNAEHNQLNDIIDRHLKLGGADICIPSVNINRIHLSEQKCKLLSDIYIHRIDNHLTYLTSI